MDYMNDHKIRTMGLFTTKTLGSGEGKVRIGMLKLQVHPEVGVGPLCRCPGIVREPMKKRADTRLVREHSTTVVSAR